MRKLLYIFICASCICSNSAWAEVPAENPAEKPAALKPEKDIPPPLPNIDPAQLAVLIEQDKQRLLKLEKNTTLKPYQEKHFKRMYKVRMTTHQRLMDRLVPPKPQVPGAQLSPAVATPPEADAKTEQ